jgi:hypothetical protein
MVTKTRCGVGLALGVSASVAACAGPGSDSSVQEPATSAVSQPLLGDTNFVGCERTEEHDYKSALRHAMLLGRGYVGSERFAACIADKVADDYVPCSVDGERRDPNPSDMVGSVLAIARGSHRTVITCADFPSDLAGLTHPEHQYDLGHQRAQQFDVSKAKIEAAAESLEARTGNFVTGVSDIIWHESMHTHGFDHDGDGLNCEGQELLQSMPWIVGVRCLTSATECDDWAACNEGGSIGFKWTDAAFRCSCETTLYEPTSIANPCLHSELGDFSSNYCGEDVEFIGPTTPLKHATSAGELFGRAMAVADFNGDGYEDLAVGIPNEDHHVLSDDADGAVDVYFGSLYGLFAQVRFKSPTSGERFGSSLAVSDFDGDGFDDLAIGRPGFDNGRGAVSIFHGGEEKFRYLPEQRVELEGQVANEQFGAALGAGSETILTNQPRRFLVVGAPGANAGTVYMYSTAPGPSQGLSLRNTFSPGDLASGARFGEVIATGPERATCDPSDGILVSAPGASSVYILDSLDLVSSNPGDPVVGRLDAPAGSSDTFGSSLLLAAVGTLGVKALVGDPGADSVFAFEPDVTEDHFGEVRFVATGPDGFGASLAAPQRPLGNVCEVPTRYDSFLNDYLLVGSQYEDGGRVQLLRPAPGVAAPELQQTLNQTGLSDVEASDLFGSAVAFGDFNGDKVPEVAVAALGEALGEVSGSFGNGAFFTYRVDSTTEECELLAPWKSYSVEGGVSEGVEPVRLWDVTFSGTPIHYEQGQIVRHECAFYEATSSHDATSSNAPGSPGSPWLPAILSFQRWEPGTFYEIGDLVTYEGTIWETRQAHTSQLDWLPPNVPALWQHPTPTSVSPWTTSTAYAVGSRAIEDGVIYECIQAHTSLTGWNPSAVPALWEPI